MYVTVYVINLAHLFLQIDFHYVYLSCAQFAGNGEAQFVVLVSEIYFIARAEQNGFDGFLLQLLYLYRGLEVREGVQVDDVLLFLHGYLKKIRVICVICG